MSIAVLTLGIAAAVIGMGLTIGCCVEALASLLKRWRAARREEGKWRQLLK